MNDDQTRSLATPTATQRPTSALAGVIAELWRYKFVVPAIAALVTAGVAFWTLRQTKIYEASATLEYDPSPSQPLGSAVEDVSSPQLSLWDTQEFYETQNFILRSRTIAERVARTLRLHQDLDFMTGGGQPTANAKAHTVESAGGRLLRMVSIAQIRDTRVVRISAKDHKPERAQLIANTWVQAYIDKSLEDRLGTSGRALEWLSDQLENLKREVENSELALYKFRESNDSLSASLEERQRIIAGQLESYSTTMTHVHAKRVQTDARLSVLRDLLSSEPDLLSLNVGSLVGDPEIVGLRTKYHQQMEELGRLSITYGEAHPQVRALRGSSEFLLAQVRVKVAAIVRGVEAELQEYDRAEKGLQGAINQVNRQGLALSLQEIDYSRLNRERSSKSKLYELVMQRAAQTDLTRALRVANGRIIDAAAQPVVPVSPKVQLSITLGLLAGLVLGVIAALGVSYLDNKVRGPADMEARGVTVLGILPSVGHDASMGSYTRTRRRRGRRIENQERDLIVHLEPRSTSAECCRTIRTNITFQSADRPLHTIAITSAMPRDGKTTVAINIATVLAQSGRRVLIIDTDLRKPRLHRAFKLPGGAGVTSLLAGESLFDEAVQATEITGVSLLACGPIPPNPSELLHTRKFGELIAEAKSKYDTVIFDTPPLGAVTDPAVISTQVDGTILVVRSGTTTRAGVDAALRQLKGVSARLIGVVLNGVDLNDSDYGSYYAYYRGYYAEEGTDGPTSRSSATPV